MVRLLVLDMLRRVAYWQLALLAFGFAMAWAFFPARGGAGPVIAMSLAATFIIGPVAMLGWLGTPVVPYLPVSRRDVWRAAWVMSTLAPLAVMTTLKLPGALAGGVAGWSSLTLSSFMDLLYAGAGCAFLATANSLRGSKRATAVVFLALPLVLGGVLWPFVIQQWLPTNWAEVRPWHGAMFAIGAALTTWSALQSPTSWWPHRVRMVATSSGSGGGGAEIRRAVRIASAGGARTRLVGRHGDHVARLFPARRADRERAFGSFTGFEPFVVSQRLFVFNPASFTATDYSDIFSRLGWFAFFVAAVSARFPEALRHLRVLPLGNATVHTLLMGWPLIVWTAIWALLVVLHMGFGQPITDSPDSAGVDTHRPEPAHAGAEAARVGEVVSGRLHGHPVRANG